jgi:hypothetical protein
VSREQKLQLERIRVRLLSASRITAVDPHVIAAWGRLGVPESSVEQVRLTLLELARMVAGNIKQQIVVAEAAGHLEELSKALAIAPVDGLPRNVRALLRLTADSGSAAMTCSLQDAGLEVVSRDALAAIRLLGQDGRPQPLDVAILRSDWGQDWRLFTDLSLLELGYPPLDPREWVENLWSPPGLVDPALSPVHRWVAFRRAINLVKAASVDDAWEQVQKFGAPSETTSPVEMEVVNLRAYLLLVRSSEREEDRELDEAIELLDAISHSPVTERNLQLLRKRKVTLARERPRIDNPYLALGVDHRDPGWKREYRSVRTSKVADINEIADANRAHDRILAFERGLPDTLGDLYTVPLDSQFTVDGKGEGIAGYAPFRTEEEALDAAAREAIEALKVAGFVGLLEFIEQEQEAP